MFENCRTTSTPCDRNQYIYARNVMCPGSCPGPLMLSEFVRSGPTSMPVACVSPVPSIYDSPVHPRVASCRSMPTDASTHFGRPSLHALSPSSCIRPSFPLWTEPTAPPLPVLHRLHHVQPPAAPSARAAQSQPHTSFLAHATRHACPCLTGTVRWWRCPSSSPVSATPMRPRPLHVSGPLFAHAVTQPASAQAYPQPRAHQCHLRHVMPRPFDSRSVISRPGPPVFVLPPTPEPSQCPTVYWSAIPTLQPGCTLLVPPHHPLIARHTPSPIPPASTDP